MSTLLGKLQTYSNRKSIKYGVPFLVLMVGGSFGLKEFSQIRYKVAKTKLISPEEAERYGIEMKKPGEVTLESEYEKIQKLDIDNWNQIRGPRPWEENSES